MAIPLKRNCHNTPDGILKSVRRLLYEEENSMSPYQLKNQVPLSGQPDCITIVITKENQSRFIFHRFVKSGFVVYRQHILITRATMEYGKTSRGGHMILFEGYSYTKKKEGRESIRWQCTLQRSDGCHGALTTDCIYPFANPRSFIAHNHEASVSKTNAQKCKSNLREATRQNVTAKTSPLVLNAINTLDNESMTEVGTVTSLKRFVQRVKAKHRPTEPASLELIDLEAPWTTTGGGHPTPFLFYDSGPLDPQRMLLFGTDDCLQHLCRSPEWFMDGNFKLCPTLFMQVYVIRARLDDGAVSCLYALLCGKAEVNYTHLLTQLVQRCQVIGAVPAPRAIKVDFELAAMNAVRAVFGPLVELNGCFYHLCQSTWRHIQALGLVRQYKDSEEIKQFVGMMDGLAFLPEGDIDEGVVVVRDAVPNQDFFPLLQYFLETYVGVYEINLNGELVQRPPLFQREVWNVFHITLAPNGSRTNNICEGWNNGFREKLGGNHHPGLYSFIEGIQRDNAEVRSAMLHSEQGRLYRTRTKRSYETSQLNLRRACIDYTNGIYDGNIHGYLTRIAHTIRFE